MGRGMKKGCTGWGMGVGFASSLPWDADLCQGSIRKDAPSVVLNPRHPLGPGEAPGHAHSRATSHTAYGASQRAPKLNPCPAEPVHPKTSWSFYAHTKDAARHFSCWFKASKGSSCSSSWGVSQQEISQVSAHA